MRCIICNKKGFPNLNALMGHLIMEHKDTDTRESWLKEHPEDKEEKNEREDITKW